jgi:allantoicase
VIDLASEAVGGAVLFANDEFFAPAANLIRVADPEWREGEYTDRGKWMDGWESRRRRTPGHDWCIVRLGIAGIVRRVVADTTHFKGNAPEAFGLDGCGAARWTALDDLLAEDFPWEPLVDRVDIKPDQTNDLDLGEGSPRRVTHVRLRIYPDGGVSRVRVLGLPLPSFQDLAPAGGPPDLAGLVLGGRVEAVSDEFFSRPDHVLQPGPSTGMHDGWETRRRRDEGHDWLVVRLGLPGTPERVVVDTSHFKGNAPGWISVDASSTQDDWVEIVPRRAVAADRLHVFDVAADDLATRVRLNLHPDGGIARFRVFGRPQPDALRAIRLAYLDALFDAEARDFFRTACGADRFVEHMLAARPYVATGAVLAAAGDALDRLEENDWLMAFRAHPRIGERTAGSFSAREQSGVVGSSADVLTRLEEANTRYEERFGFPFIVFASGRTGEELLSILDERIANDRDAELQNAATEQRRITDLRLRRMLCVEVP